jgi:hypothetical protein
MSPEGPSSSTEHSAETLSTSSRRRVSLSASSSYPFLNLQQPSTSSSTPLPTQHSSTLLARSPSSSTTSAAPLPPPPPNRIFQTAPPSRLHQRAKSSGYGGLDQINQAGPSTFLSRSVSTGGAAGSGGTGARLAHPQVSSSSSTAEPGPKRQRKKWSEDETKQLVDGCNKVSKAFSEQSEGQEGKGARVVSSTPELTLLPSLLSIVFAFCSVGSR